MRIVVCVKQVPDLQGERGFTPAGRVDRQRDENTMNELDEHAVEAALVLAEQHGGEVTALTVGPPAAQDAVRRALQMGAHHGVHVTDEAIAGSDVFGTAEVLAAAVRRLGPELVITGMAALDALMSVVPSLLAAKLEWPQATLAAELTATAEMVRIRRDLDHHVETIEVELPALVSVTDQANEPRYPTFPGIMAARRAEVTTWTLADLGLDAAQVGEAGARTRVLAATERPPRKDRVLLTDDGAAGRALAAFLAAQELL